MRGYPGASTAGQATSRGDIVIGNDVWVGLGATIMSGVTIGDGAVIGARSVVTKSVAPYTIVAGNPARQLRKRFSDEIVEELVKIAWWDWPLEKIAEAWPLMQSDRVADFVEQYRVVQPGNG